MIGPCLPRMSVFRFVQSLIGYGCQVTREHSNPGSGTGNDQRSALNTRTFVPSSWACESIVSGLELEYVNVKNGGPEEPCGRK